MNDAIVRFQQVDFGYERRRPVLKGIDLSITRGKVVAIMGASGSGKTTLLRLLGGQIKPTRGQVEVNGRVVHELNRDELYAMRRRMGMLFQMGALFTDMTVFDNVAFPLREHTTLPESMIRDLVLMKLHAVGLRGARRLTPAELSGGMARRVALARALALDPPLMIYDEPLTGLDPIASGGFIGGATLGAENQFLPIQISRETLPPDVPRWGSAYKAHLRRWQHLGVVRIQSDALPYTANFVDLDPEHRDRSGLGLPVVRITYDLRENELRQARFFESKAEHLLDAMGAARTWRGPSFTGALSSHDVGGCRMSDDPAAGVVDRDLRVHDTPGLYVFSGAVFPSCPGINPTLTLWALCSLAADRLIARLKTGQG